VLAAFKPLPEKQASFSYRSSWRLQLATHPLKQHMPLLTTPCLLDSVHVDDQARKASPSNADSRRGTPRKQLANKTERVCSGSERHWTLMAQGSSKPSDAQAHYSFWLLQDTTHSTQSSWPPPAVLSTGLAAMETGTVLLLCCLHNSSTRSRTQLLCCTLLQLQMCNPHLSP
jgi:hypothetical protein